MTIRKLFALALTLITLIVIGLSGAHCWRTIREMGELHTGMKRIEAVQALANIQGFISSERGVVNLAMDNPEIGSEASSTALRQARQKTDDAVVTALTRIDALAAASDNGTDLLASASDLVSQLAGSRHLCDEQLNHPFTARRAAAQQVQDQMNAINTAVSDLVRGQVSQLALVDGSAYASSQIAGQAGALRSIAGAQAGLLQALVIRAKPVGYADRDTFLIYEGQVQQLRAGLLAARNDPYTEPELKAAIDAVDAQFLGVYQDLKTRFLPHFLDGAFPMNGPQFRAITQPMYPPVIALRDKAYDVALAHVSATYRAARMQMIASIIATLLTVLALRIIFMSVNRKLANLAMRDALVGLPNRLLLQDRLTKMLEKAQRNGSRFALMFLDIDNFKPVNDVHGHHVGDQLLIAIAHCLCGTLRAEDTIARVGGDEFVLLTAIQQPQDAELIAQKLIRTIDRPITVDGQDLRVTISVGIAIYPDDGTTQPTLMTRADAAMYEAKQQGKNNYRLHGATVVSNAEEPPPPSAVPLAVQQPALELQ